MAVFPRDSVIISLLKITEQTPIEIFNLPTCGI
jgi:hypothetical protein